MNATNDNFSTRSSSDRELERFLLGIGGRIARAREDVLRLSKTEMADRLGVGYSTQDRYEKGERIPDAWYLKKLSEISGVCAEYLMTGSGDHQYQKSVAEPQAKYIVSSETVEVNGLTRAILLVEQKLKGVSLESGKRAKLIALVYNDMVDRGHVNMKRIDQLIDLVK